MLLYVALWLTALGFGFLAFFCIVRARKNAPPGPLTGDALWYGASFVSMMAAVIISAIIGEQGAVLGLQEYIPENLLVGAPIIVSLGVPPIVFIMFDRAGRV